MTDLKKIWADMNKPEEYNETTLEDFFEVCDLSEIFVESFLGYFLNFSFLLVSFSFAGTV